MSGTTMGVSGMTMCVFVTTERPTEWAEPLMVEVLSDRLINLETTYCVVVWMFANGKNRTYRRTHTSHLQIKTRKKFYFI